MSTIKKFESVDEAISFQLVTPTIEGKEQKKELVILIESPFTKKNNVVMTFDQETAVEIANEILRVISEMNNLRLRVC